MVTFYKQDRERRQNCLKQPGLELIQEMKCSCPWSPENFMGFVITRSRKDLCSTFFFFWQKMKNRPAVRSGVALLLGAFKNMTQSVDGSCQGLAWDLVWPHVLLGFGWSPAVVKAVHLLELQLGAIPLSLKLIHKYFSGVFSKMVSDFRILSFKETNYFYSRCNPRDGKNALQV